MQSKLSKSPVKYVLAQVKFSSIEGIVKYIPELQDKIRDIFPHYQEVNIQTVQLREGQPPSTVNFTQWHFIDKGKNTGIILDKQTITIHTSCYERFQVLIESFEKVITQFQEILNISLFMRLGLRYLNLIDDGIAKMDASLQGFKLKGLEFQEKKFLTKMETTQQSQKGMVRVQATRIGDKKVMGDTQNIFIPPDLADIANLLSFKNQKELRQEFLILDIDHFCNEQADFIPSKILSQFNQLHEVVYQVFCQAAGEENLEDWR